MTSVLRKTTVLIGVTKSVSACDCGAETMSKGLKHTSFQECVHLSSTPFILLRPEIFPASVGKHLSSLTIARFNLGLMMKLILFYFEFILLFSQEGILF